METHPAERKDRQTDRQTDGQTDSYPNGCTHIDDICIIEKLKIFDLFSFKAKSDDSFSLFCLLCGTLWQIR
jgi:hypothetical protein